MTQILSFIVVGFVFTLLGSTNAECTTKKDKKAIKQYDNCLKQGFLSDLGCESGDRKPNRKLIRKCQKVENNVRKCGYSCKDAKVDGTWSHFGAWSECSAECGGGTQTRIRSCSNPAPANGGADCEGDKEESQTCNTDPCPVDGVWSDYSDWSDCDCNEGTQSRSRSCSNPAPEHGGADCEGEKEESQTCTPPPCPEWVEISEDIFLEYYPDALDANPFYIKTTKMPTTYGAALFGLSFYDGRGNIIGGISVTYWDTVMFWLDYCVNTQTKFNTVKPWGNVNEWKFSKNNDYLMVHLNGDSILNYKFSDAVFKSKCAAWIGAKIEKIYINYGSEASPSYYSRLQGYEVDGVWSDYSDWSDCDCNEGTQSRSRSCSNPAPEHGGADCEGDKEESQTCTPPPCPEWVEISADTIVDYPDALDTNPFYIKTTKMPTEYGTYLFGLSFYDEKWNIIGSIHVKYWDTVMFWLHSCVDRQTKFNTAKPWGNVNEWKFTKNDDYFMVHLNGDSILNYKFSDAVFSSDCATWIGAKIKKIHIHYGHQLASPTYYSKLPAHNSE